MLAGPRLKWVTIVVAIALSALVLVFKGEASPSRDPAAGLPAAAESTDVARALAKLPSGQTTSALVVFSRKDGGTFTAADKDFVDGFKPTDLAVGGQVSPPRYSPDDNAAFVAVPLRGDAGLEPTVDAVETLRGRLRDTVPDGLAGQVTGGAGVQTDIS